VKAKTLLLFISFACAPALNSFGQLNCITSTKLICQFPASGVTLEANTVGSSSNQASLMAAQSAALAAANPINASIATQLTHLPIPSATVGVVSLRQKGSDVGVPFDNLGPVLTDRPDTVGKGHLFVGFSYQRFNFNAIDGIGLGALPIGFTFSQPSPFNPSDIQTFYGAESNNVSFKLNQYVGVATYGITRTTDVSIILPFNSVSTVVATSGFQAYVYDAVSAAYTNQSPAASTKVSTSGSANGMGDITVNLKQMLIGSEGSRAAVAAGASMRFPSGDALNYLGSGAIGGNLYGLFEYRARLAPHLKLSYQWNGNSQVMNLQQSPNTRLPGGLEYDTGADVKIARPLTLALDILGSQFVNTPSFTITNAPLSPTPAANIGIASTYPFVNNFLSTYTSVNFSAGVKWSPVRHLLLYGNVMTQLNNVGLRSDPVPLFGIAYNFKTR
jgi:hypothetical protein